jgi:hypothetical protein
MRPHPRDPSARVALGVGIVGLVAAIASVMPQLQANTWIFRDGRFYVNVATTIVEDLTLDQHAFAASWYSGTLGWNADLDPGWSNVALGARGEHWPKHPWVHPLIASPAYFAFGLPATLGWNLLMFAVIAHGLYRFARGYARPAPAALAATTFALGTVIVQSAYDFSVDVLMLALFAQGLAALLDGRGARAGVLVALAVIIKPTALMLLPALALMLGERRDRRELGRSLLSGTAALLSYAGINTWMYGRPWWSGYNRTLVTQGGRPVVADHLDAFSTPFVEGFLRMWGGSYGLVHSFTVLALAAPGMIALARRRPLQVIGAISAVSASFLVFARYSYEGHRFHWPALALLVPSLAITLELAGALAERALARWPLRTPRGASTMAALAAAAGWCAVLPFGASLAQRAQAGGPWGEGLVALTGSAGIAIAVDVALGALLVSRLVKILERLAPSPVAAAAVVAGALLPEVRDGILGGGASTLALALAAVAADQVIVDRTSRRGSLHLPPTALRHLLAALALGLALFVLLVLPARDGEARSLLAVLHGALDERTGIRLMLPWLVLAAPGVGLALWRDRRAGASLAALVALAIAPGVGARGDSWDAGAALVVIAPSAIAADAIGRALARATRNIDAHRGWSIVLGAIVILLAIGGVRGAIASAAPFRIATERGARTAVVMHEDVPCDFLAWEHMSWECSHFDAGLYGMVGLAVSEGIRVGGVERALMIVPTGRSGQQRRVIWPDVRGGTVLRLTWAVPDAMRGDAVLEVWIDDRLARTIEVPMRDEAMHVEEIATPGLAGRRARLELRVRPRTGRRQAAVALDAIWE